MAEIVLYLSLLALVSMVIGLLVGRYSARSEIKLKVEAAYREAREELENEKKDLAFSLNDQLLRIRESIIQSADAYETALRAVEQKLGVDFSSDTPRLQGGAAEQLQLEFKSATQRSRTADSARSLEERAPGAVGEPSDAPRVRGEEVDASEESESTEDTLRKQIVVETLPQNTRDDESYSEDGKPTGDADSAERIRIANV